MTSNTEDCTVGRGPTGVTKLEREQKRGEKTERQKSEANWANVLFFIYLHLGALYGGIIVFKEAKLATVIFALFLSIVALVGVTVGAHRLWAHRCFTATWPLRLMLMLMQTMAAQGSVYDWVREHRLHHKYHGTEFDPYNYRRGFSFSHLTCRLVTRNPEMKRREEAIDMSDLEKDDIIMFQKRFYWVMMPIIFFLLPVNAPAEYWGESILNSFFVVGPVRYALVLNVAWLIYSGWHVWLLSSQNVLSAPTPLDFFVTRSNWPRYHYLLPWDYRCGEFGSYGDNDYTTRLIGLFVKMGWVSNTRTVTSSMLKETIEKASENGTFKLHVLEESGVRSCILSTSTHNAKKE